MNTNVGLWIDHKKAIIVTLNNQGSSVKEIESGVEKHLSRSGDSPLEGSYEAQMVPADNSQQRAFTHDLNGFYDEVIDSFSPANAILIFGPGEAKTEFKKRLEKHKLADQIVGVEAVDQMTEGQITAKVRDHFAN